MLKYLLIVDIMVKLKLHSMISDGINAVSIIKALLLNQQTNKQKNAKKRTSRFELVPLLTNK